MTPETADAATALAKLTPSAYSPYVEGAILLALGLFGLRKLYTMWTGDSVQMSKNAAEKDLVDQLHKELSRMSQQGLVMSGELAKLQLHIVELTRQAGLLASQVNVLTDENGALREEIGLLRAEVSRLQGIGTNSKWPLR